ncbi:sigma-54-dependent transcriptional regulator [Aporhodopirellula aestuarii]|uniref:Sigma-54 dependent transcriptional regulator n=1 Tax=Aporhodopirellula aestuarii TaxID=2950107 RepID=A0ABT0U2R1_9BACT|nr:sigma-54 dependent transcriptional regulator [Aporhodopirellula aestuarii]MCM2371145.1 sigma-54 dependent transcriptional regulator [Aporhodopirellula aestuarii]
MIILVVDDERPARYALCKTLRGDGRTILEADNGELAVSVITSQSPDLVFLDLTMPGKDGLAVLDELSSHSENEIPEIVIVTGSDSIANAVQCVRRGATDFVTKPYDVEHIRSIASRTEHRVRLQEQLARLRDDCANSHSRGPIIGASRAMRHIFEQIDRAANANLPVLIRGESGTGKELVAQQLHERSDRKNGPFLPVNTAAISATLIESELFGHVKGAFTGAERSREGVFRRADGGTLFLDEIGDMPAEVQTRLLRVLQESVVQPVGSEESIPVDVRIISATHQDLESAIENKLFRLDLFYRLQGIEIALPPLRQRHEDILLLATDFLSNSSRELDRSAVAALVAHHWPGNVRELKQRIQSAAAMSPNPKITARDLGLCPETSKLNEQLFNDYFDLPLTEAREQLSSDFERAAIIRALEHSEGNVSAAARSLGIHRQSLQQKMTKLGL